VIVDGGWTHKHAKSSKKIGNKYCVTCAHANKENETPQEHF
jgi:hypothetical protein